MFSIVAITTVNRENLCWITGEHLSSRIWEHLNWKPKYREHLSCRTGEYLKCFISFPCSYSILSNPGLQDSTICGALSTYTIYTHNQVINSIFRFLGLRLWPPRWLKRQRAMALNTKSMVLRNHCVFLLVPSNQWSAVYLESKTYIWTWNCFVEITKNTSHYL